MTIYLLNSSFLRPGRHTLHTQVLKLGRALNSHIIQRGRMRLSSPKEGSCPAGSPCNAASGPTGS
eukprot:1359175-Amphidinium_carterae.1